MLVHLTSDRGRLRDSAGAAILDVMNVLTAVVDTNVFVAAGFNPDSAAASILGFVRKGRLVLVWSNATRAETELILRRIPALAGNAAVTLFRSEHRWRGALDPDRFDFLMDSEDRKFAALAEAAKVPLITSDQGLLQAAERMQVPVLTPAEFLNTRMV